MNIENPIPEANSGIPPQSAVSVYGQTDAMDDFPVLKAFQQYVDAEQAKAHKRMMTVCIFFTILLLIVISVFMFIIFGLNRQAPANNDLTMKLMEMNQSLMTRSTVPVQTATADAKIQQENLELKAKVREQELEKKFNDRLAAMTEDMKKATAAVEAAANRPVASVAPTAPAPLSDADREALNELKKKELQLSGREEKLKAREAKVQADAQQVREERIDLQQRKLYPDAFSPEARRKADAEVRAAKEESDRAKAEARAAVAKATDAERAALAAQQKAEDAERAAELREARLAKRERELAERERQMNSQPKPRTPKPVVTPKPQLPVPAVEAIEILQDEADGNGSGYEIPLE